MKRFDSLSSMLKSKHSLSDKKKKVETLTPMTVDLPTGVTLEYVERGKGKKNLVILIHGWLDSWYSFSNVIPNLPEDYHAIAITQRGHGLSSKPKSGYEMSDYAKDIAAFMDHFGYQKADIVGHSMGSAISQRFAIDFPEKVDKLVLIGSAADITKNEVLLWVEDYIKDLEDPIDPLFILDFQGSTAPNPVNKEYIDGIVTETSKIPADIWRVTLDGLLNANSTDQLGKIKAPTLLMWGFNDEIFPITDQKVLLEGIKDITLAEYENLNHSIQWQQPRLAALEIGAFLTGEKQSYPDEL